MTIPYRKPSWSCPEFGQMGHDWLSCDRCSDAYENFLEGGYGEEEEEDIEPKECEDEDEEYREIE